jgi:hypothetical protein
MLCDYAGHLIKNTKCIRNDAQAVVEAEKMALY